MTAINSNRAIRGPVTAVPVVAGKGVRLVADTENNRWVVEADETVLWEDTNYTLGRTSVTLSESYKNFEVIKVFTNKGDVVFLRTDNPQSVNTCTLTHFESSNIWSIPWKFTDNITFTGSTGVMSYLDNGTMKAVAVGSDAPYARWEQPVKIIGINRIASN